MDTRYSDPTLLDMARKAGVTVAPGDLPLDREVRANGLRLHYLDWGDDGKPAVLFLHGRAQTAHMWDYACLALRDRYRCLALDQRGHGDSQWAPDGDYSLEAGQRDLDEFAKAVGLERFVLVGLSMGGRNAYVYAASHPEQVRALVIVDSGPEMGRRMGPTEVDRLLALPDEAATFEEFVLGVKKHSPFRTADELRESLKHSVRQLPSGRWTWKHDLAFRAGRPSTWRPQPDYLWECLRKLAMPTLIVRGGQSGMLSPEVAGRMAQTIKQASLVVVERAGHRVPGDNPPGFERALVGFLDGLPR